MRQRGGPSPLLHKAPWVISMLLIGSGARGPPCTGLSAAAGYILLSLQSAHVVGPTTQPRDPLDLGLFRPRTEDPLDASSEPPRTLLCTSLRIFSLSDLP